MKYTLEGSNARVIAKAVQSLSKVGKEMFIEVDQQALQMRAINATQSAVGSISFKRSMFEVFDLPPNSDFFCKISMKGCLAVFRNMNEVQQVNLRCKLETTKEATISIIDDQNINTNINTDQMPNIIRGDHKLFTDISNNFNSSEEELTLEANSGSVVAKNYIEGARVNDKFMRTQLKLKPSEFDQYQVTKETIITFCIKEFRAFLLFGECLNASLTLEFDDAGMPLLLKIKKHGEIECLLIMSTLSPDDVSFSEDYCQRELTVQDEDVQEVVTKRKSNAAFSNGTSKRKNSATEPAAVQPKRRVEESQLETSLDTPLFQFRHSEAPSVQQPRILAEVDTVVLIEDEAEQEALMLAAADAALEASMAPNSEAPNSTEVCFFNTDDSQKAKPPETLSDDDETIPQSPERPNKVRTIFSRCFQRTFVPREPSPNTQVYAPNSDTED
ncbi:cell cycle checkpoint control protein RAD9A isoform X2 [Drosophila eugracilis]|uniref:cell cycle checkpoint control protein RAD9A isoform X2 n=1 Tax=Drosophila eugracilis TaxID=29029 RepID=UPI0007E66BFF|nr:cell cycle checkpoint control protein RAD9A isoform X2 [Drosophila eugracilis]